MPIHFADRLAAAVRGKGNPVLVGLDPRVAQLPDALKPADPTDLASVAAAYGEFCRGIVDVVAPLVAVVKPQSAFFEELGPPGVAVLVDVIRYARSRGLLVILDAKRGDIGSTAEAYAAGMLGQQSPWGADALTINPYLGDDSLAPFVSTAKDRGAGLFVLVKTSNPGGRTFQDLTARDSAGDSQTVYRHVAALVESLARETVGPSGYGSVGAVVGATYPAQLAELRAAMPHTWFLVPGYGSQGGAAADVAAAFDASGLGAIINSSRAIIFAHARKEYAGRFAPAQWQQAVEAATRDMIDELRAGTSAGNLQ
ncbi:MAG: orotidine-5'-phosphate decarboxylase [Pirellulales bacterium]